MKTIGRPAITLIAGKPVCFDTLADATDWLRRESVLVCW